MTESDRLPPRGFFTVSVEDVAELCQQVQQELPAAATLVWLVVRLYSWQIPPKFVDIPDEQFQKLLGYSRQYVSKTLKTLEERGLIERRGRRLIRATLAGLSDEKRQQLFTSTNVYVNNQHEEESSSLLQSCNPVEEQAQTSTTVYVAETNGATSTNDDVLRQVMAFFEQEIGGTVTLMVAEEMRDLTAQNRDVQMWQDVFRASVGKRSRWPWIKAVMTNGGLKRERNHGHNRGSGGAPGSAPSDAEQRKRDAEAAERLRRRGVGV